LITYWKGHIEPKVSEALVSQVDLLSSLASLVGSEERGKDSEELLDVFLGKNTRGREELILEATGRTALRKGDWVLIPPYDGPAVAEQVQIELGNAQDFQLYNLSTDLGEQQNLAVDRPEKLEEMISAFKAIRGGINSEAEKLELK